MAALSVAALLLAAPAAEAETQPPVLDRARTALAGAEAALDRARGGRARLAALGEAVKAHEVALAAYRGALRTLAAREWQLVDDMQADSARLERLIVALQSLGQAPRSALLAVPGGPVAAARAAQLIAEVSPALDARIDEVRDRIGALSRLHSVQEAARIEARGALAALQDLRAQTHEALTRRRRSELPAREEIAAQAASAARLADDLEGLAAALEGSYDSGLTPLVSFSEARGLIPSPVAGVVAAWFGGTDPWGRPAAGITISAPAYAEVSAPWDATVRYAGPLIDYGKVVVLEPEEDTLIVLAGLATVDRVAGETVLAGERLGDLGGPIPASNEFLLEATTDRGQIDDEMVYIELRRAGEPVDPALWFNLATQGIER